MAESSWQEKFYELADLYLKNDVLLLTACQIIGKSQAYIEAYSNALGGKQLDHLEVRGRHAISKIVNGEEQTEPSMPRSSAVAKVRDMRKVQQQKKINVSKAMEL